MKLSSLDHYVLYRIFLVFKILLLVMCVNWQPVSAQTTYYVSSSGNDSNAGNSADLPFQTLSKINNLSLQAGDAILFRRGDTFRGSLVIRQSGTSEKPIVVDAYGSGDIPILAGSVPVTNWTSVGNNVWQADCPSCGSSVTGLYRNSVALPLGRYPNLSDATKGYLTVQSHSGKTQLTSQQGLSTNWTGGEAVIRPTQWILDRATITQQNGNTLSLTNTSSYDIADGWGFFIQNHPATLDQVGEWYYNPANKTIRLFDNQNNPNNQFLTATAFNEGINLTNVSFITVRNLQITQAISTGLLISGGSNFVLSNNSITNSGEDAISVIGSGNTVLVENNIITDANSNGFYIGPYQNFTFRGNTLQRIGLIPGRGKSGDGTYSALQSLCNNNTLIENNVVDNIGYNGIAVVTNATVRYNQVSNFCLTKSDGGGIYTWNGSKSDVGNLHILSNIVFNGIGAPEGTPGGAYSGANGIFLDDCSQNAEVANNTSFGSRGMGIFLRGVSGITVNANTSFNNTEEQLKLAYNGSCLLRNNVIQNNILFSRLPNQVVAAYESNANDLSSYGQFNYNYYVRPFEDLFKIRVVYNPGSGIIGADRTLTDWQSMYGKDANSFNSPITYKSQVVSQTGDSKIDNSFSSNADGWSVWSPYGNGRNDWDNTNRLDGGSLRLSFGSASNQSNSYLLATINIGAVTKGKAYQLLFDGVASSTNKRVEVYPRQLSGSYSDLAPRTILLMGTTRQQYEAVFIATADESNAILVVQVIEDGQTAWFDNIRLKEATLTAVNPDDNIKLVYNSTAQNKTVGLDGTYRDAKNVVYTNQIVLTAFSSAVLMKDVAPITPPVVSLRDPENPANAVTGLDYKYYEGNWGSLPDFNGLTPVKTDVTATPTIGVRNRDTGYGLRFAGYVSVPTDGQYTFYTSSDDGTKLLIGTTEVVTNDGVHGDQERSGTIGLKAGIHAMTVLYFQGEGGQNLTVSYSGPGLGKQSISATALLRVGTTTTTPTPVAGNGTGLLGQYFNNNSLAAPSVLSRTDATINFDWGSGSPVPGTINTDNFSVRWTGQVQAPVTGSYTFSTVSDDGVRLWVNGTQLINNWTGHAPTTDNGTTINLTAGQRYTIIMEYFEWGGGAMAQLLWAYSGQPQQVIPQGYLFPATATATTNTSTYLSDLNWTSATSGYGPVEKDRSNGDANGGDGQTLTLNGVTYAKGLGAHAPSEITYNLGGQYTHFITDIGIDDEMSNAGCGTAVFNVYVDNVLVYSSGVMTPTTATKSIDLDVTGKQTLKLVVTDGGDNYNCDHADWAGARLTGSTNARIAINEANEFMPALIMQVYPIPAREEIRITYQTETAGEVLVQLVNTTAQSVIHKTHPVSLGENLIRLPVGELTRGFYILTLIQNGQRVTRKVILSE